MTNLYRLYLESNQISNIEAGAFSDFANLTGLYLGGNQSITDLNLEGANLSGLRELDVFGNTNITSVSLKNAVLNQPALAVVLEGGYVDPWLWIGIGELPSVTELCLSGIDFSEITDLTPLGMMDDLTDLWLVGVENMDAAALDVLLDDFDAMQGTAVEGVLYLTQADYDAFNTAGGGLLAAWDVEDGHHVYIVPEPATLSLSALGVLPILRRRRK